MALGQTIQDGFLNWLRGTPFPAPPSVVYVSLHSGVPPSLANEVSNLFGGRVLLAPADLAAPVWMNGVVNTVREIVNTKGVVYGLASTGVTLAGFALWDAASNGNLLISGSVTPSAAVSAGDPAVFLVGDLKVRI